MKILCSSLVFFGFLICSCLAFAGQNSMHLMQSAINSARPFDLEVEIAGDGNGVVRSTSNSPGILCAGDCSESYLRMKTVTLVATSEDDSNFTGWLGACSGSLSTCNFVMDDPDEKVIAVFSKKTLIKEEGIWWGLHNGGRPTFYFTHNMADYPPTFIVVEESCGTVKVINNGYRFESNLIIVKQSDVSGRGMAMTNQAGQCTASRRSHILYFKEDMPRANPPILIP